MHHDKGGNWRILAVLGLSLAAAAAARGAIQASRRGRHGSPDSAPRYTARRSFGSYDVTGCSVTIRKPRAELFAFWREFSNLAQFMENLETVQSIGPDDHSRWLIRGPMDKVLQIETRIAREVENELIAWRSTENSEIETEGRVTFHDAPGDRGTRVGLIIAYKPPGGQVGKAIAKLMGAEPEVQARRDLKRFKMLMETGEIATSARRKDNAEVPTYSHKEIA